MAKQRFNICICRSILLISTLVIYCNGQHTPKKCPIRSLTPTTRSTISTWSDLKHILESSATDVVVLPSFQVEKIENEPPIQIHSAVSISCVSRGACILSSNNGGSFLEVSGGNAELTIVGLTFRGATDSAVVIRKDTASSINGVQLICGSNFIGGTGSSNAYGAGGGAIYNEGDMSVRYSTFDDNSSQIGVIYTGQTSKLFLSQNTFMLGDNQFDSASIYVFASDSDNYIDGGGNRGYDEYYDDGKVITYCRGVYVNNEDECMAFAKEPLQQFELDMIELNEAMPSQTKCTNLKGVFRNHLGDLKRCLWLLNDTRRSLNCNGLTELGRMCRKACLEDCSLPLTSDKSDGAKHTINRRKKKKMKIIKKRMREREEKLRQAQSDSPTKVPTSEPTHRPSPSPTPRPSSIPTPSPSDIPSQKTRADKPSKKSKSHDNIVLHTDSNIVFYVIGDAPYKVSELDPKTGFPGQVRGIPNDAEFVVHVGDILSAKESECHLTWYQQGKMQKI
eukprot:scaffold98655_cov76-Cyclotella_meneghiniana.AAC.7